MEYDKINRLIEEIEEKQHAVDSMAEELEKLRYLADKREGLKRKLNEINEHIAFLREKINDENQRVVKQKEAEYEEAKLQDEKKILEEHLSEIEKELGSLYHVVEKGKNFDKSALFKNIRQLLKNSDVNLGEIEKNAGNQPGYMSRLEKPGNTTDPSIEYIVTAAKMLNVSVDFLINGKAGEITPTEAYILRFLDRLKEDTRLDTIEWKRDTSLALHNVEADFKTPDSTEHPLFKYREMELPGIGQDVQVYYNSSYFPKEGISIINDCYHGKLRGAEAEIYIMACESDETDDDKGLFYEIYLIDKRVKPVCCSVTSCNAVSDAVAILYKEIEISAGHVHLQEDVREAIDSYMDSDE